ncbi:MAG: hypothetical protein QM234_01405 [Acidobacteriota bacterium]|nr:hypothetical protein [Acidobacteriota bacterium]
MVEPMKFGPDENITSPYTKNLPLLLRKMSKYPKQPRVFSQALILLGVGIPGSLIMTLIILVMTPAYFRGTNDDLASVIAPIVMALFMYTLTAIGLFRRYGVDEDKVWSKFGHIYYKEVRFDEITDIKLSVANQRYKLYKGDKKINLDYTRFDYTLAFIRIMEELQHRRFALFGVSPDEPGWEDEAQVLKNSLAWKAYDNQRKYYNSHPEDLAKLNALVQPPATAKSATQSE